MINSSRPKHYQDFLILLQHNYTFSENQKERTGHGAAGSSLCTRQGVMGGEVNRRLEGSSSHAGVVQQEVVSEAELHMLRNKLGGLKMMASAVGEELDSQNKALDDMTVSAERADARIQDSTRKAKKLT